MLEATCCVWKTWWSPLGCFAGPRFIQGQTGQSGLKIPVAAVNVDERSKVRTSFGDTSYRRSQSDMVNDSPRPRPLPQHHHSCAIEFQRSGTRPQVRVTSLMAAARRQIPGRGRSAAPALRNAVAVKVPAASSSVWLRPPAVCLGGEGLPTGTPRGSQRRIGPYVTGDQNTWWRKLCEGLPVLRFPLQPPTPPTNQ